MMKWIFTLTALLFVIEATAQQPNMSPANDSGTIAVSIGNTGPAPVEVYLKSADGSVLPDTAVLGSDEVGELDLEPGTQILVVKTTPGEKPATERKTFMTATVSAEPATQQFAIPDPRALEVVNMTFTNGTEISATLAIQDHAAKNGLKQLGEFEPGASKSFPVYPGGTFVARTKDGAIFATYQTTLEQQQTFDLGSFLKPVGKTVPVKISNFTATEIAVEESLPGSIVRVAALKPWHHTTIDAVVGAILKIVTNDETTKLVNSHKVKDEIDQSIIIQHDLESLAAAKDLPTVELSRIPEKLRTSAIQFIETLEGMEANNPRTTGYIVFNGSDKPMSMALLENDTLTHWAQVKPHSTGRIIGKTGSQTVFWPGSIEPKALSPNDISLRITASRSMPRFIDVTPPNSVNVKIANAACRPLNLYRLDAFGHEQPVGQIEAVGGGLTIDAFSGAKLVARLGRGAANEGDIIWRGRLNSDGKQSLRLVAGASTQPDPLDKPRIPEGATDAPRTVIASNRSSRALEVYTIDTTGAAKQMFDELNKPLAIPASGNLTFYEPEGQVMVFRRPDAPAHRGEYGRYRVTNEANQVIEIGELKSRRRTATGAWVDNLNFEELDDNDVGTRFLTLVNTEGSRVKGSTNVFDGKDGFSARLEGCTVGTEGYGYWYDAVRFATKCDERKDSSGVSHTSWGRYRTRLENGILKSEFGYCDSEPAIASSWKPLPNHFDDMDPATEGFTHGMMETAWAPPGFEWLGHGFNLLYTDPLNFSSTEDRRASSKDQIFAFKYQDTAGRAKDSTAQSIFGVTHKNQNAGSSNCVQTQTVVKTLSDLRDFSSHSYGGSIGVPGIASFSLSKSHSEKNTAATGRDHLYIMERCDLKMDELIVNVRWTDRYLYDHMRQPLEAGFRRAVETLPLKWGNGLALKNFIEKYGTHFSEQAVYGGTFYAETQVKKETFQRGFEVNDGIGAEASATVRKVSLGGSYKNETGESRAHDNKHENSSYHKWSVGGNGSQVYETWASSVASNEKKRAPIQIKFRPIHNLITPVFFPDDPDIGTKNALVQQAVRTYFRQYAGVDVTTDPPTGLNKRDPRNLCVRMEALKVTAKDDDRHFGGDIKASFVDQRGEPASGQPATIALGNKMKMAIAAGSASKESTVSMDYEQSATFGWFQTYCTGPQTKDFVWTGSLCLNGTFVMNDSSSNSWRGDCNFSPKLYSIQAVETNIPVVFKDSIVTPSAVAEYKLKVWVE